MIFIRDKKSDEEIKLSTCLFYKHHHLIDHKLFLFNTDASNLLYMNY